MASYRVAFRVLSLEQRVAMVTFMEREFRPLWVVQGLEDGSRGDYMSKPFAFGRQEVGVEYASNMERNYAFTLVRWMAIQVGRQQSRFIEPKRYFKGRTLPCYSHAEGPAEPIDVGVDFDELGLPLTVDKASDFIRELGYARISKAMSEATQREQGTGLWVLMEAMRLLLPEAKATVMKPIRAEMERLDKAWRDSFVSQAK